MSCESTCYGLQYDPYLISVACPYSAYLIWEKIWAKGKGSFLQKVKNFN